MLQQLYVQNYAIIDEITISFSPQLNIITGETGAGKSILMGALNLILGERADTSVLLNREKKGCIEGRFAIQNNLSVIAFLKENNFEEGDELNIRREIAANGKSRAFLNDTPATLQQLRSITSLLVDMHQQFDNLDLSNSDFQREVLDTLAHNSDALTSYSNIFKEWATEQKILNELLSNKANINKERDYDQFLLDELLAAAFKENELEEADKTLQILNNSENIKVALHNVYTPLKEGETPIVVLLKHFYTQLQPYENFNKLLPELVQRLKSAQIELQDIANEVEKLNDEVSFDAQAIEVLNERLSSGYKLLKKHHVTTTNDLLSIQNSLEAKLAQVLNLDNIIAEKEKKVATLDGDLSHCAELISNARKQQIQPLEEKVNQLLAQVGMPNARVRVQMTDTELNLFGKDKIEFLFDANKSNRFEPIRKVASGGELSRLMLCIKSLVAQHINWATMIFDEIDTGISGEAAKQVGVLMQILATNRQVICITHQPQIAAKAHAHYFVYKQEHDGEIKTRIRLLKYEERVTAIAQMLSGEPPTTAAIENAKDMMQ